MNFFNLQKSLLLVSALLFFSIPTLCQGKEQSKYNTIIFDIGDTLFTHDSLCVFNYIGWLTGLKGFFRHPLSISTLAREALWGILRQDKTYDTKDSGALDPWGAKMPSLEIAWLDGFIENKKMLEKALFLSETYSGYKSSAQKEFVQQLIMWKYGPHFADCMQPIKPAVELLHKLAAQRNHQDHRLYRLFILSNYAPEHFYNLYNNPNNKRDVFNYFSLENIFVSGIMHDSKPRLSSFETLLKQGAIDPKNTIFIDDQIENIKAAELLGITGVLWDKRNPQKAYTRLKKLGILL